MHSGRFDPKAPPGVGRQARINTGQFEGYVGTVTRVDEGARAVYFTISVFDRPVELCLDFYTAAEILDLLTDSSV